MHRLEMPFVFAGIGIDSDDRVAVKIGAGPIATPIVACGRSERHVEEIPFGVDGHVPSPDIHALTSLPSIIQPRFVAWVAGLRDRFKLPDLLAGFRVIRASVSGAVADRDFAVRGANNDEVFVNGGNTAVGNYHIRRAIVTERGNALAGNGVDRHQFAACCEDNTRLRISIAWPICNSARRDTRTTLSSTCCRGRGTLLWSGGTITGSTDSTTAWSGCFSRRSRVTRCA